jgi:SAM-dependent methyltransferase
MQSRAKISRQTSAESTLKDDVAAIGKTLLANSRLDELRAKHDGGRWYKYLDIEKYLPFNVRLARMIGLREMKPQRILDIGCGGGLFMYVARYYGHDPVGIDIEDELLGDMAAALGVERRIAPVLAFQPASMSVQFGLITCIGTVFERHNGSNPQGWWSSAEWKFFLSDLQRLLTPDGQVFLRINRGVEAKATGKHFYDEGLEKALAHGVLRASEVLLDRAGLKLAIERLNG